mmetsp:Transcript_3054/g.8294  ORF Transcript_3054/g.8294 Transcript_3054/m.8294 type:complete len:382 (-) Transcript_3054:265-1410(-)
MEVDDSSHDNAGSQTEDTRVAVHPLAIVHMSDQYTRISSGGSPLETTAPVVGLLFGLTNHPDDDDDDDDHATSASASSSTAKTSTKAKNADVNEGAFAEVLDADDIPVDVSEASKVQVDLHRAVFPKHKVVGWYRVVSPAAHEDIEPNAEDLAVTKLLKKHHASSESDFFCFCLLKVQRGKQKKPERVIGEDEMKTDESSVTEDTLNKELPINLYQLHEDSNENTTILQGLSNWQLETSPAERLSVERVMKERPSNEFGSEGASSANNNPYVIETKAVQHSLVSMNDRVRVLTNYLRDVEEGNCDLDHGLLRKIQQIVCSLGPLSSLVAATNEGEEEDVEMLAHLAIVARTVNTIQSFTEKFRVMNESRNATFERPTQPYF